MSTTTNKSEELQKLLEDNQFTKIPQVGDVVEGKVVSIARNEIRVDIEGFTTGVIRGREIYDESREYSDLKEGDEVEATVIDLENENGELELSFRYAGHQKAWDKLKELMESQTLVNVKVTDANKGGLMVSLNHVVGFLPVSQLKPEHYPRVSGGDKSKILEKLKKLVGQELAVKVIDINETENKLIVSEKQAWEEAQQDIISQYKVGDKVIGKVTAVTDFGVFIEFGNNLEGLIHISELAWQRIDHPREIVKVAEEVEAEIINIEGSKIFLSMKKLQEDPWTNVDKKYKTGQVVKGKVLKINPFGLFVELDKDIHGLAHISELSHRPISSPNEVAKVGDELEFMIMSIKPEEHRLGLSLRALQEAPASAKEPAKKSSKKVEKPKDKEEEKEESEKEEKK